MLDRRRLLSWLFFASLILLIYSWWHRDEFADDLHIDPALADEPLQEPAEREPFTTEANEVEYVVRPLYRYELHGLVVSFKRFTPGIGLHERWNDYINVADVCVIWGDNARELDLNEFSFSNGEFTCRIVTRNEQQWRRFNRNELSNNHLITDDERIRDLIDELEVGDQIRISGWLSEYGEPGGPFRRTSDTRTDTGDGACETVYLADMQILDSMNNLWRRLFWLALIGLVTSVVLWFRTPYHQLRR